MRELIGIVQVKASMIVGSEASQLVVSSLQTRPSWSRISTLYWVIGAELSLGAVQTIRTAPVSEATEVVTVAIWSGGALGVTTRTSE